MFVMGTPAPQGSKRHVGRGVMVESSKKVGPWREAVVAECQRAGLAGLVLDGPLRLSAVFYFARPKSHYRTGRNALLLRDNAPTHPIGPPDLSKLVRATEDALTQCGAIKDDARIVAFGDLRKEWCDAANPVPGAWVQVHPVAQERPVGWVDPAPRVLPGLHAEARASVALDRDQTHAVGSVTFGQPDVAESFRCACGNAALLNVSHSAAICVGPEQDGAA